jgi:hypothetical protein
MSHGAVPVVTATLIGIFIGYVVLCNEARPSLVAKLRFNSTDCYIPGHLYCVGLDPAGGLSSAAAAFAGESNVSKTGGWTTAIGIAFLGPYNLSDEHSTWSANGTRGPIHQAASRLGIPIYYYQAAVDRQAADKQPR